MKKLAVIALVMAIVLALGACAAPAAQTDTTAAKDTAAATENAPETKAPETKTPETNASETLAPETTEAVPETTESVPETDAIPTVEGAEFNVYSLKGPTSMGLVTLLRDSSEGKTVNVYNSTMCTAADEVTAALVNGDADIALLPVNAAAALFNKAGGFSVVAINTLGVLYVVENGESIQSVADLAGKTVYMTGKGTVPEYSLRYILSAYEIEDQVTLEFKAEPQEVVSAMAEDTAAVGLLPQPFVTAALAQNEGLRIALSLSDEWAAASESSTFVTGVTVVRNEVLEQQPAQVAAFLQEASEGVDYVNSHPEEAAELIAELGIVAKAPLAQKALPYCNIVCIRGEQMKNEVSGYLKALFDQNPKAVGGAMPADEFYYTGE